MEHEKNIPIPSWPHLSCPGAVFQLWYFAQKSQGLPSGQLYAPMAAEWKTARSCAAVDGTTLKPSCNTCNGRLLYLLRAVQISATFRKKHDFSRKPLDVLPLRLLYATTLTKSTVSQFNATLVTWYVIQKLRCSYWSVCAYRNFFSEIGRFFNI